MRLTPSQHNSELINEHHDRAHGLCVHGELRGECDQTTYLRVIEKGSQLTLNALATRAHGNALAHGFWEGERNFGEMMALIHSEVTEALECHRAGEDVIHYDVETGKPEGSASELIDVIIRCLDVLASQGVDIDKLMAEKMEYNESRPYKHGKKY